MSDKHKVLVIERSATLRHLVVRALRGSPWEPVLADSYHEALEALQGYRQDLATHRYQGVVLGWPGETTVALSNVVLFLEKEEFQSLAVVIMSFDPDTRRLNWVASRYRSQLLLWDDYARVPETLDRLLSMPGQKVSEEGTATVTGDRRVRVLFVDDSPTARAIVSRLLRASGYPTEVAATAQEAWEKTRRSSYDIAIVDYFMPDTSGADLCRRWRKDPHTSAMATAILTGSYLDQVIHDCVDAGATDFMFKSEAQELFLARLRALSRSARVRRAIAREEKRLEGILSSVGEGVYGVDRRARITFMNAAAKGILGYPPDAELVGKRPHELFHYARADGSGNEPQVCFLQQAYERGDELHAWESTFWDVNGKPIPVECTVIPLRIDGHLEGSVVAFRDVSRHRLVEEELRWQVNHDHLTKLLNRRHFDEQLRKEIRRLRRSRDQCSALLYIDLDRFKYINDNAGHAAGDQLLIQVARLLATRLRRNDLLARLGGDEFGVILRDVPRERVMDLAEAFRLILDEYVFSFGGQQFAVGASIGAAVIAPSNASPERVLANADMACQMAKQRGRNVVHLFDPQRDPRSVLDLELGWSARLRAALQTDGFLLHFQPIVALSAIDFEALVDPSARSGSRDGEGALHATRFEVLVRLTGRDGKIIYPSAFLANAERFNLMGEIDRWVLDQSLRLLAGRSRSNGRALGLSINLSVQTLADRKLHVFVRELFGRYAVRPEQIVFEISESSAISNIDGAKQAISDLSEIGCRFALDDFGYGFGSFHQLKQLEVSCLKIDGMFIQGMVDDPIDQALVRAVNDVAHSLGKQTVAEYVETFEQLRMLRAFGADFAQGYFIGRPGPGYF